MFLYYLKKYILRLCLTERGDPRNFKKFNFFSLLQINILFIILYYYFKYHFQKNYTEIGSGCVARPTTAFGLAYNKTQSWWVLLTSMTHDARPYSPAVEDPKGYPADGSLCQGPSLLGVALLPDPMMVGLGAQQRWVRLKHDPLNLDPASTKSQQQ